MKMENSVLFKGSKEGIIVLLDKDVEFGIIKEQLEQKITDAKKFFGEVKSNILLDGRELTEDEEKQVVDIISNKINIDASYIKKINKKEKSQNKNLLNFENGFGEINTKFHKGTLRSGQKVTYNGSVVVLGDVNPGSEITATGNIIVLGALKGIVHAGCKGEKAYVAALKMNAVQLRIADIIGRAPDNSYKKAETNAELAYIHEDMIYIEPIDAKLLNNL
ncbi:MAG: septum site-determining protein MinC [Clostridiales bacterium GWE2_32_10]|nr:MAG: septum site-determining protein MinC [Clostridiales bacterium GWE2_32_10]HBY19953.1 septum site-determining protein MinC [Clostridiales bacterium]